MLETTPVRNLPQVANLWEFVFFYIPCKYENDTLFVEISSVFFGLLQNCESEFFVYALHYDLSYSEWLYVLIWSNSIGQHSDYLSGYISRGSTIKTRTTEMDGLAVGREFADFKSLSGWCHLSS